MNELLPLEIPAVKPRKVEVEGIKNPVVSVLLNTAALHLSRPLDFVLPTDSESAQIGAQVKVKVNHRDFTGIITRRSNTTDWQNPLRPIERVIGKLAPLDQSTLDLLETVSLHYGAGPAQLLRFVLPRRRLSLEESYDTTAPMVQLPAPEEPENPQFWQAYGSPGQEFLHRLQTGQSPRAVLSAIPLGNTSESDFRFAPLAQLVQKVWQRGEQSLIILPTTSQATEVYLYLQQYFAKNFATDTSAARAGAICLYTSEIPAQQQYQSFLQARFGQAAVIVGTRQAVFLPMQQPGLFFCWDDMSFELSSEMYPNFRSREVLLYRTQLSQAALVLANYSVSAGDLQLVQRGFAQALTPDSPTLRQHTPRFQFLSAASWALNGPQNILIPPQGLKVARQALAQGPVLLVVAAEGKFLVVSCANCTAKALCPVCRCGLSFHGSRLECSRCGHIVGSQHRCQECGSSRLRGRLFESRTVVEDIGRFFPNVPLLISGNTAGNIDLIDKESRIVIATFGSEPRATNGYAAALILQPNMLCARSNLWVEQEVMRRFLHAASLVRPKHPIFVCEPIDAFWQECLARWDPWTTAENDLAARQAGNFAPAWRTCVIRGDNLHEVVTYLHTVIHEVTILGPVPVGESPREQAIFVSVGLKQAQDLGRALRAINLNRASQRSGTQIPLRIEVDPEDPSGQVG